MRKSVNFLEHGDSITCLLKHKEYYGLGTATYNPDSIEEQPNELTGKKVAYLKAKRDTYIQRIRDKKLELKHILKYDKYLFPAKYQESLDWMLPRREKRIKQLNAEIEVLAKERDKITGELKDYLFNREEFLKRLQKSRLDARNDVGDIPNPEKK